MSLAGAVGFASASAPPGGDGFVGDSALRLLNRNFYMNRDFRKGGSNSRGINGSRPASERNGYREEWAHGVRLDFVSGYSRGTVGFGLDIHAHAGFKLDSGRGRAGTDLLPISNNRTAAASVPSSYGKIGAAARARLSATEIRWGSLRLDAPVFSTSDSRLLPAFATGILVRSREIDDLFIEWGHITAYNFRNSTNSDDGPRSEYTGLQARGLDFLGGTYRVSDTLGFGLYALRAEDFWNQQYLHAGHETDLGNERSFSLDLHAYRTRSTGSERAGNVRNLAWSLAGTLGLGGHDLRIAYQRHHGDEPFDYFAKNSIYLANASQYSDFSAPGEQSVGIRHVLDWSAYGIPGLTSKISYAQGWDIDGTHADPNGAYAGLYGATGKHNEINLDIRYVVPQGRARGLSIRLRQAFHDANDDQGEGDVDQFRLIIDYPLELL